MALNQELQEVLDSLIYYIEAKESTDSITHRLHLEQHEIPHCVNEIRRIQKSIVKLRKTK